MKRKVFTFLLIGTLGVALSAQEVSIKKASTSPVVDGVIDAVWEEVTPVPIDKPYRAEEPSIGESTWKALYDDDGFFILLQVQDDVFFPAYADNSGNTWEYDKPEIYFDVNEILQDGKGAKDGGSGHYQIAPGFVDGEIDGTNHTADNGVQDAFLVSDPTYIAEYFVPFSLLLDLDENDIDKTRKIGFDVTIIDREDASAPRQRMVWSNIGTEDESWSNMDECGTITLEGFYVSGIEATSVSVAAAGNATTIETDEGTLQMTATVLPSDADIKTVNWKVISGTGTAFIGADGILHAMTNGTVTVTATTMDGSDLNASIEITLSNQSIGMADVSLIKGGDFLADGPVPAPWSGDAIVSGGVAECDPPTAGANPWDWILRQTVDAVNDKPYIFTFYAWADEERTFNVDFEDSNNGYARYGISTDPESTGESDWTFICTTEPTKYVFHVTFDRILENTNQSLQFMLGNADAKVYLDSVYLVAEEDLNLKVSDNNVITVSIYPNPVVDQLTVNLSSTNSKVAIYSSLGSKMEEVLVKGNRTTFNVSSYARGVYFIKVNNDTVVKFVK
jgi:hypothetical protein